MINSKKDTMKRSISMPVKPRYLNDKKMLERSDEKESLFSTNEINQVEEIDQKNNVPQSEDIPLFESKYGESCRNVLQESLDGFHRDSKLKIRNDNRELHSASNQKLGLESHDEVQQLTDSHIENKNDIRNSASPCVYQDSDPFTFGYNRRVIHQSGYQNIRFTNIPKKRWQYLRDFVTTMIEQKWIYAMTLFISGYFAVWFFCAGISYLIGYAHGDFSFNETTGERLGEGVQACIQGANTYTNMFIYTMETHTSIGFGERYPTDECPEGVFFFAVQLILYIGVQGMLVSIIYSKIARPPRPRQMAKPKFSTRAVICLRNGRHCLIFRVCDQQEQQSIGTKVTVYLLENKITREGEYLQKQQIELKLEDDGRSLLLCPTTICHVIDQKSPFYKCTANDFLNKDFEIMVSCTGTSPSTGQFTEYITSYMPNEIYWGERFKDIVHYDWKRGSYAINYDDFDKTVSVAMPIYSAYQIQKMLKDVKKANEVK